MDTTWKTIIWRQFAAAIDTLENAIVACPDDLWDDRSQRMEYWYAVYHTLFWLDFYMSESSEGFAPPPPFTLEEMDPAGILPERPYTKEELQGYLDYCRAKSRARIETVEDATAPQRCRPQWPDMSIAELMLYTMRHVQHHSAQLNLILRERIDSAPRWVARGKEDLVG